MLACIFFSDNWIHGCVFKVQELWHKKPYFGHLFLAEREKFLDSLQDPEVAGGCVNILPAFFHMVDYLIMSNRKFKIIFRTFGDLHDVELVMTEFNKFCNNEHHRFRTNDEYLANRRKNYVLDDSVWQIGTNLSIGYFYVDGECQSNVHLVLGSIARPAELDSLQISQQQLCSFITERQPTTSILNGFDAIYKFIQSTPHCCMALRDFYYWWNAHNERPEYGKLHLVDTSDTRVLSIFVDDNIRMFGFPNKGIVNLRDAHTGEPLPQEHYLNTFLHHVCGYKLVVDHQYYIKMIEHHEKSFHSSKQQNK